MKNRTHKMWRKVVWTFVTSSLFGLTAEVPAQSPYAVSGSATTNSHGQQARQLTAEQQLNRALEIKTELAWLSAPALFPHRLEAHVLGSALQAKGALPNEALHAEALRMARAESNMSVMDGIKVYPTLAIPPVSKPAQVLSREVTDRLGQALPACVDTIATRVWMKGQVVLSGTVPSCEDKLTASRCLQRLAGCGCVVNQLEVHGAVPVVAALAPAVEITQPAGAESRATDSQATLEQIKMLPPQVVAAETSDAAPLVGKAVQPAVYNSESSTAVPVLARPEQAAVQSLVVPTIAATPQPAPTAPSITRGGAAQAQTSQSVSTDQSSPIKYHPTKWRRLDGGTGAPATVTSTAPAPSGRKGLGGSSGYILIGAEEPETPVAPAKVSTEASTQIQTVEHREVLATEHAGGATDGTVFFDDTERAVAPTFTPTVQPVARERAVAPKVTPTAQAVASERTVAPAMRPTVQPAPLSLPERLQQLIAKTCNKPVQDVHVTVLSAGKLDVRVKASAAQECESLSKRIFELPELTPFQVSLEIPVTH